MKLIPEKNVAAMLNPTMIVWNQVFSVPPAMK